MLPLSLAEVHAVVIAAAVLGVAIWERLRPITYGGNHRTRRWIANIGLYTINTTLIAGPVVYLLGLLEPTLLSTNYLFLPPSVERYIAIIWWVLVFDLVSYFLHRVLHAVPLLYRLHCAHHSDCNVDLTTAFRHHPLEFILNAVTACAVGLLFGAPIEIIGGYGIVATALQIWHHGNLTLPPTVDRIVAFVLVTPSMHRLHHSIESRTADSNYGTVLSIWDRIFCTKIEGPKPRDFGVKQLSGADHQRLDMVLLSPILVDPHR